MTLNRKLVVADTTKVRIFKQITTIDTIDAMFRQLLLILQRYEFSSKSQHTAKRLKDSICCCWYYKGTNFQANHNNLPAVDRLLKVVADTTKVRIFKQITTRCHKIWFTYQLLLILQRYEFSSKSQQITSLCRCSYGCCWYYKGTNFQANHNVNQISLLLHQVVADTTKVRIFKQITTNLGVYFVVSMLLLILQRYEFSSKSQLN